MAELEALIISLFVMIIILITYIICCIIICLVRCSLIQSGYEFCPRAVPSRRHHRRIGNQHEEPDDDESGKVDKLRDLSQAPPPAYRNANQYQNVNLEHTEVVQIKEAYYRLLVHCESIDTTSLPPDYTSQRPSISVAPEEL